MTYNHASYIVDAMNGFCMQQTNFPFLAIICDDASTDGEQIVIRNYMDKHFVDASSSEYQAWEDDEANYIYARHQQNLHCYFLIVLIKTNYYSQRKEKEYLWEEWDKDVKYIALCEGDDYWTSQDKLEKQVKNMDAHPDCSFCVHDYSEWNQDSLQFATLSHDHLSILQGKRQETVFFLDMDDYLFHSLFTRTLTSMYRKSSLVKSNYDLYSIHFDMVLFFALFTQGDCIYINEVMGCYRHHNNSITGNRGALISFQKNISDNIFSIVEVESSSSSQRFVYNMIHRNVKMHMQKKQFIWHCIKYLGARWCLYLFFRDFLSQIIRSR